MLSAIGYQLLSSISTGGGAERGGQAKQGEGVDQPFRRIEIIPAWTVPVIGLVLGPVIGAMVGYQLDARI